VLKVPDESPPVTIVDVVTPFEDTHWGTREMSFIADLVVEQAGRGLGQYVTAAAGPG